MKYKKLKVFDCQDMPDDVREIFYNCCRHSNGTYVKFYVHDEAMLSNEMTDHMWKNIINIYKNGSKNQSNWAYVVRGVSVVDDWLFDNGAKIGEEVLVKYWW